MKRPYMQNPERKFSLATSVIRADRQRLDDLVQLTGLPLSEVARRCIEAGLPIIEAELAIPSAPEASE